MCAGSSTWYSTNPAYLAQFHKSVTSHFKFFLTQKQGLTENALIQLNILLGTGMTNANKVANMMRMLQRAQYDRALQRYLEYMTLVPDAYGLARPGSSGLNGEKQKRSGASQKTMLNFYAPKPSEHKTSPSPADCSIDLTSSQGTVDLTPLEGEGGAGVSNATSTTQGVNGGMPEELHVPPFDLKEMQKGGSQIRGMHAKLMVIL
jgi:hypothetical protein